MSIKPMLFNAEMVRALQAGRKTVTRRVVKPRYRDDEAGFQVVTNAHTGEFVRIEKMDEDGGGIFADGSERYVTQPAYTGDILWVRETWQFIPCIDCGLDAHVPCGSKPVTYEDKDSIGEGCFVHRADYPEPGRMCWRPSIHMPREAARLFLRVTGVRVERLQDITYGETQDEGIWHPKDYPGREELGIFGPFAVLWDSTIKPADLPRYGWEANPWVWVIEFERCEKPAEEG